MYINAVPNRDSPPAILLRQCWRDQRGDRPQVVYGVMTDKAGRPLSVDVYPGNTSDPRSVPDQIVKVRKRFGLARIEFVADPIPLRTNVFELLNRAQ